MRQWLKDIRIKNKMTQADVANLSGVNVTMYNKIELGGRNPSPKTAQSIANVLCFNWARFFDAEQEAR